MIYDNYWPRCEAWGCTKPSKIIYTDTEGEDTYYCSMVHIPDIKIRNVVAKERWNDMACQDCKGTQGIQRWSVEWGGGIFCFSCFEKRDKVHMEEVAKELETVSLKIHLNQDKIRAFKSIGIPIYKSYLNKGDNI